MTQVPPPAEESGAYFAPEFESWPDVLAGNVSGVAGHDVDIAGRRLSVLREQGRREALTLAREWSSRHGIPTKEGAEPDLTVVATGHQPGLYHPGVWLKVFALQEIARSSGSVGLDIVVDTDGFDAVGLTAPRLTPRPVRGWVPLASGARVSCYRFAPAPSPQDVESFARQGAELLAGLPHAGPAECFARYCEGLRIASREAGDLSEAMTTARRRYEGPAGTDYLELPVSVMVQSTAYARFVVHMAQDARAFRDCFNGELAAYREASGIRTAAQPFPDLAGEGGLVELPFWSSTETERLPLWAEAAGSCVRLLTRGGVLCELPSDPDEAVEVFIAQAGPVYPRAVAMTSFVRLVLSDLFIHGTGGGRYDSLTDAVIRGFFGIEPPAFVVASATLHLPVELPDVSDDDLSAVRQRLHRLRHNPDQALVELGEEWGTARDRARASELAAEKSSLVEHIGRPDADRKALGLEIRRVNERLAELIAPVADACSAQAERLTELRADREVLADRTYPFCLWEPGEVAWLVP